MLVSVCCAFNLVYVPHAWCPPVATVGGRAVGTAGVTQEIVRQNTEQQIQELQKKMGTASPEQQAILQKVITVTEQSALATADPLQPSRAGKIAGAHKAFSDIRGLEAETSALLTTKQSLEHLKQLLIKLASTLQHMTQQAHINALQDQLKQKRFALAAAKWQTAALKTTVKTLRGTIDALKTQLSQADTDNTRAQEAEREKLSQLLTKLDEKEQALATAGAKAQATFEEKAALAAQTKTLLDTIAQQKTRFDAQTDDYGTKLIALQTELDKAKIDLTNAAGTADELARTKASLAVLQHDLDIKQTNLTQAIADRTSLQKTLETLQKAHADLEQNQKEMAQTLEKQKTASMNEKKILEEKFAQKVTDNSDLEKQIEQLNVALKKKGVSLMAAKWQKLTLQAKLDKAQKNLEQREGEHKEAMRLLLYLIKQLSDLKVQLATGVGEASVLREKIAALNAQVIAQEAKSNEAETKHTQAVTDLQSALDTAKEDLKTATGITKADHEAANNKIAELQLAVTTAQTKFENEKKAREDAEVAKIASDKTVEELRTASTVLQKSHDDLKKAQEDLKTASDDQKTALGIQITKAKDGIDASKQEIKTLQDQLKNKGVSLAAAKWQRLVTAKTLRTKLDAANKDLEAKAQESKKALDAQSELNQQLAELRSQLVRGEGTASDLQKNIATLNARVEAQKRQSLDAETNYTQAVKDLKNELARAKADVEKATGTDQELKAARDKIALLDASLITAQADLEAQTRARKEAEKKAQEDAVQAQRDADKKLAKLQADLERKNAEIAENLKQQATAFGADKKALEEELRAQQKAKSDLEAKLAEETQARTEVETAKKATEDKLATEAQTSADLRAANEALTKAQAELGTASGKERTRLDAQIKTAQDKIALLEKQALLDEIDYCQSDYSNVINFINATKGRDRIDNAQGVFDALIVKLDAYIKKHITPFIEGKEAISMDAIDPKLLDMFLYLAYAARAESAWDGYPPQDTLVASSRIKVQDKLLTILREKFKTPESFIALTRKLQSKKTLQNAFIFMTQEPQYYFKKKSEDVQISVHNRLFELFSSYSNIFPMDTSEREMVEKDIAAFLKVTFPKI